MRRPTTTNPVKVTPINRTKEARYSDCLVLSLTIEVARRHPILAPRGRISINNATCSLAALDGILKGRYAKFGSFPVLIRADKDAIHEDVRKVMDVCTANGVWKVGFVAVQDAKDKTKKRRP